MATGRCSTRRCSSMELGSHAFPRRPADCVDCGQERRDQGRPLCLTMLILVDQDGPLADFEKAFWRTGKRLCRPKSAYLLDSVERGQGQLSQGVGAKVETICVLFPRSVERVERHVPSRSTTRRASAAPCLKGYKGIEPGESNVLSVSVGVVRQPISGSRGRSVDRSTSVASRCGAYQPAPATFTRIR